MTDDGDVRLQLNDLEAEEARIMRELRELDDKAIADTEANKRRAEQYKDDPAAALTSLLLECEKEVREAKGYIADDGPPLRIVRLHRGETGPKTATFLSRPRNTGVDFTVPVTLKAYTDLIKHPIFLNQIRDKIKHHKYASTDDYLDDMRLLSKNTAQFNKGPDLAWVVQHARFLLDAAEEAVAARRVLFREVEEALRQRNTQKTTRQNPSSLSAVGKRKRSQTQEKTNGDVSSTPPVGSAIEIYWPSYRKWYLAYIIAHGEGGTCHLRYDEDNSVQWVTLDHERWRVRNSRVSGAARGKRAHEQPAKRRKAGATTSQVSDQPAYISTGITPEDLDAFKIDLCAKFDDLRESIVEYIKDHFTRMDREIIRSDTLSRILVQGEDNRANTEGALQGMEKRYERLEKKVDRVLEKLVNSNIFDQSHVDLVKEDRAGEQDTSNRAEADDPKQSSPRSGSLEPNERDGLADSTAEVNNEQTEANPTKTGGSKSPRPDPSEKVAGEEGASLDAHTEEPSMKPDETEYKKELTERKESIKASEIEHEGDQKNSNAKNDVEMSDVADDDKQTGPDADDIAMEDKAAGPKPILPDAKTHPEKGNRPIRDEVITIEENDNLNAGDNQREDSDQSSESDDSESGTSVERGKRAGKQPAEKQPAEKQLAENQPAEKEPVTMLPAEKELMTSRASKDPGSESEKSSEERASMDQEANADVSAFGGNGNGTTAEESKADGEPSKEKPSDEIETAAVSAAGSEATEREKHNSPSAREPSQIDPDKGD